MERPVARLLDDGRLYLSHGPIDLVITAEGEAAQEAYEAAKQRFADVLEELSAELVALRTPNAAVLGPIAQRMARAVAPFHQHTFITPMAAVAGAVSDEMLAVMTAAGPLSRAFVNNGGDIALYLSKGTQANAQIAFASGGAAGNVRLGADDGVGGIATSGRHGRSLSLGIADSVTALARSAAEADATATLIANGVDLVGHPKITRTPAEELDPDSDLAGYLVVTDCAPLERVEIAAALVAGATIAEGMRKENLIAGAALFLQGGMRLVGPQIKPIAKEPSKR